MTTSYVPEVKYIRYTCRLQPIINTTFTVKNA